MCDLTSVSQIQKKYFAVGLEPVIWVVLTDIIDTGEPVWNLPVTNKFGSRRDLNCWLSDLPLFAQTTSLPIHLGARCFVMHLTNIVILCEGELRTSHRSMTQIGGWSHSFTLRQLVKPTKKKKIWSIYVIRPLQSVLSGADWHWNWKTYMEPSCNSHGLTADLLIRHKLLSPQHHWVTCE